MNTSRWAPEVLLRAYDAGAAAWKVAGTLPTHAEDFGDTEQVEICEQMEQVGLCKTEENAMTFLYDCEYQFENEEDCRAFARAARLVLHQELWEKLDWHEVTGEAARGRPCFRALLVPGRESPWFYVYGHGQFASWHTGEVLFGESTTLMMRQLSATTINEAKAEILAIYFAWLDDRADERRALVRK